METHSQPSKRRQEGAHPGRALHTYRGGRWGVPHCLMGTDMYFGPASRARYIMFLRSNRARRCSTSAGHMKAMG